MKWISLTLIVLITTEIGFSQYLIPFRDGEKWGYSNYKGEITVKPQFDEVQIFKENLTGIRNGDKYAVMNLKGIIISDFKYDTIGYWGHGLIFATKGTERICLDNEGSETDCLMGCRGGIAGGAHYIQKYERNGKIGIRNYSTYEDKDGNVTGRIDSLPPIWDELIENHTGLAAVKKDNKWGIINFKGQLVVDYVYDSISVSHNYYKRRYFFKIRIDGKIGFLTENGKPLIPPIYYKADFFEDRLAKVWVNKDYWGYIDGSGHEFFTREATISQKKD